MAFQSARDSRVVTKGSVQTFSIGSQGNPLLLYAGPNSADMFYTVNAAIDPDVEAVSFDGETALIRAGEVVSLNATGAAGAWEVRVAVQGNSKPGQIQVMELGAAATIVPGGASTGIRDVLIVRRDVVTTVVGSGVAPLALKNTGPESVFLTVNSGTDPDPNVISTDANTLELHSGHYVAVAHAGVPFEVRARTGQQDRKRGLLELLEQV